MHCPSSAGGPVKEAFVYFGLGKVDPPPHQQGFGSVISTKSPLVIATDQKGGYMDASEEAGMPELYDWDNAAYFFLCGSAA